MSFAAVISECRVNVTIENTVANSTAAGIAMNSDCGIQYT